VGWNESTIYEARRQSAAAAFVTPVLDRPNLTVVTDALATRLVLAGRRATGVVYLKDGALEEASGGEVVVCAGAVDSPKLLLASGSPVDPPLIDPRHLAEEADVRGLVRGIELTREIGAAPAFAEWGAREVVPGPDADLEQYVREVASTWFHPVGTCRMGIGGDA